MAHQPGTGGTQSICGRGVSTCAHCAHPPSANLLHPPLRAPPRVRRQWRPLATCLRCGLQRPGQPKRATGVSRWTASIIGYWNRPCSSRALPRGRFRRWWRPFFRSQSPCREPVAKKRSGHSVRVKRTWTRRRNWRRRRRRRRRHGCSRSGGPPRRPPDDTCQIPSDWRVAHVASRGRLDARHPATTLRHAPPAGRSHSHSHRTAHALQYGIVAQTTLSFRVSGAATSDPKWRRRHLDP